MWPAGEGDRDDGQPSKTSKARSAEDEVQNLHSRNTPINLSGSCAYGNCRISS